MSLAAARATALAAQQNALRALYPVTLTIGATNYDGSGTIKAIAPVPTDRGYEERQEAVVQILKTALATCPTRSNTYTLNGFGTWKLVTAAGQDATSLVWVLTLQRKVK